ncbi:MAG: sigma-70 family RNA polymerase sigma factor [Polyangiaceae bacterium]|nr:sigma-70 family RNA polymerase sigma factor [Polyangiaceae bacterium]
MRWATRTDAQLISAISQGEPNAFDALYKRHLANVTGFFMRRLRDRELAFDLVAETFAAVVASSSEFDPARGTGAAWLFGIASNKLRESARRGAAEARARQHLALEPIAVTDGDLERVAELAAATSESSLQRLLGELSPAQRHAVWSRVVDEQSYETIAASMRCSEQVVRKRVSRDLPVYEGVWRTRERLRATTSAASASRSGSVHGQGSTEAWSALEENGDPRARGPRDRHWRWCRRRACRSRRASDSQTCGAVGRSGRHGHANRDALSPCSSGLSPAGRPGRRPLSSCRAVQLSSQAPRACDGSAIRDSWKAAELTHRAPFSHRSPAQLQRRHPLVELRGASQARFDCPRSSRPGRLSRGAAGAARGSCERRKS